MAPDNRFAMTTATDDMADVPMADVPMATTMNEDGMSGDEENQSRGDSVSQNQVDGSTDANAFYDRCPPNLKYAQLQGLAKLRELLNDPKGEIEDNIRKTAGWNPTLASNERCKKVRKWLSDEKEEITAKTVPYVLATWCMLGGQIPSVWIPRKDGKKSGFKGEHTPWGAKMVDDLEHIGFGEYDFHFCNDYDNGSSSIRTGFDWTELEDAFENPSHGMHNAKEKSKPGRKHAASSPRQSLAAKRQKDAASEVYHAGDDDTEDEGSRGWVGKDVKKSGEEGERAWKTQYPVMNSNRRGFPSPQGPTHGRRDRENAPQPPQQIWATRGARGIQDSEDSLRNDAASRRCVPGLEKSDMFSNTTFIGQTSRSHKNLDFLGKPTTPRLTADVLSSSRRDPTTSSGQPLFGMPSSLQQASPVPFGAPSLGRGSTLSSAQPSFPTLHRRAEFGIRNKILSSSSPSSAMKDREGRGSLHGAVSNRDNSDEGPLGAQRVAFAGAFKDLRAREEAPAETSKPGFNTDRIIREHAEHYGLISSLGKQNIEYRAEITRLHNEGFSDRRVVEESIAEIRPFEEDANLRKTAAEDKMELPIAIRKLREAWENSERRADHIMDLLNRTSVAALLQSVINQDAGLGSTSLAKLLEGMHGNHGSGMSGPKESDGHHDRDGDVDEGAPQGLNKDTGEVVEGSAGLGELEGQEDGKGQGDNRVGDAFQNWRGWVEVSSNENDSDGAFGHK